nr:small serum protein 3-like [Anolis sagrei ordinatus]
MKDSSSVGASALFSLIILFISLSWCNGYCATYRKTGYKHTGGPTPPHGCDDPFDGKPHEIHTEWPSARCMNCKCGEREIECCRRYPHRFIFPGCIADLDFRSCQYFVQWVDRKKECPMYFLSTAGSAK